MRQLGGIITLVGGLALGACGSHVCECETLEGAEQVEVDRPSDASCESLAGEGSPYAFCYDRGESLNLGPSGRPPVGLAATIDSLEAGGWGVGDELPMAP
ncbi:MAG: hypothetical protein R2909_23605 [Gemmatimonadales bacterium]